MTVPGRRWFLEGDFDVAVADLLESDIIKYTYKCFTDANRIPSEGNSVDSVIQISAYYK